jgi:hypothetical protein
MDDVIEEDGVDTFTKTVVEFDEEAPREVKSCYTNK